jgi:hypothetical protein
MIEANEAFALSIVDLLPSEGGLSQEQALSMARNLVTWSLLDGFRALHNGLSSISVFQATTGNV